MPDTSGGFDGTDWEYHQAPLAWPDNVVGGPWTISLAMDPSGTIWTGARDFGAAPVGVLSLDGNTWIHYMPDETFPEGLGASVAAAPDGTVWAGSGVEDTRPGSGVARFEGFLRRHRDGDLGRVLRRDRQIEYERDGTVRVGEVRQEFRLGADTQPSHYMRDPFPIGIGHGSTFGPTC